MGFPPLGQTVQFGINPREFILARLARHGPIFKGHLLGSRTVFMVGPEALQFTLQTHRDHFRSQEGWPKGLRMLMGGSLLMEDGDTHRRIRRVLGPAFSRTALDGYAEVMQNTILRHLAKWEAEYTFAFYDRIKQLTFDIASQLLLRSQPGRDLARLGKLFRDFTAGMEGIHPIVRIRHPWTPFGRAFVARDALVRHVTNEMRRRPEQPAKDTLGLLLDSRDADGVHMTDQHIAEQALFLLFAGHESSTSLMTSTCLELACHPDVLRRARQEQRQLGGDSGMTSGQIDQMQFLDQILLEVERLHPPFTGSFRIVAKPFEFGGCYIPAGWHVFYCISGTHHSDVFYEDPSRFDPDRFHGVDAEERRRSFRLVGFGGGPRTCLGLGFARLEAKMLLAHLLRRYRWELLPGQRLDPVFLPSIRPKDGLRVTFRRLSQ